MKRNKDNLKIYFEKKEKETEKAVYFTKKGYSWKSAKHSRKIYKGSIFKHFINQIFSFIVLFWRENVAIAGVFMEKLLIARIFRIGIDAEISYSYITIGDETNLIWNEIKCGFRMPLWMFLLIREYWLFETLIGRFTTSV